MSLTRLNIIIFFSNFPNMWSLCVWFFQLLNLIFFCFFFIWVLLLGHCFVLCNMISTIDSNYSKWVYLGEFFEAWFEGKFLQEGLYSLLSSTSKYSQIVITLTKFSRWVSLDHSSIVNLSYKIMWRPARGYGYQEEFFLHSAPNFSQTAFSAARGQMWGMSDHTDVRPQQSKQWTLGISLLGRKQPLAVLCPLKCHGHRSWQSP